MPTVVVIGLKSNTNSNNWNFDNFQPNNHILRKIETKSIPLSRISAILRGFEIGRDQVSSSGDIKFITGSDVSKWTITKHSYITSSILTKFIKDEQFFNGERILIRETGSDITALFLDRKLYCNRSLYSIKIIDERFETKFILALLNSKLLQFYYASKFKCETDLFPKIRMAQTKMLPIKYLRNQKPIVDSVDQILIAKKAKIYNDISQLEKQIDEMVYELYDLTDDEISLIEGSTK
jgi:hypothetical protein